MNKRRFLLVVGLLLMVGMVSGALVNYISDTIMAQVNVKSPISLVQSSFVFSGTDMVGGNYEPLLLEGENKVTNISTKLEITVKRWDGGNWTPDTEGIHIAVVDVSNSTGNWLDWVKANSDITSWSVDSYPSLFDTSFIVNNDVVGYNNNVMTVTQTIPTGNFKYGVIFQTETNLMPSEYRVEAVFRPNV